MKQGSNPRRSRNRGGGKRQGRSNNFDSNGPEGRVRGTAQQVFEKYQTLARDAQSSGDRIASENFYQHAEHYYRILNADGDNGRQDQQRGRRRGNGDDRQAENQSEADGNTVETAEDQRPEAAGVQAEDGNGKDHSPEPAQDAEVEVVPIVEAAESTSEDEEAAPDQATTA